jgi:hypothetical protein
MSEFDEGSDDPKPRVSLEQWRLRGSHLVGVVYNHPRLENGATVGLHMGRLTLLGPEADADTSDTATAPPLEAGVELETSGALLYQLGQQAELEGSQQLHAA